MTSFLFDNPESLEDRIGPDQLKSVKTLIDEVLRDD